MFTQQYVKLDDKTYLLTWLNGGTIRVRVVTKRGTRILSGSNASSALIARIVFKATYDLQMAEATMGGATWH